MANQKSKNENSRFVAYKTSYNDNSTSKKGIRRLFASAYSATTRIIVNMAKNILFAEPSSKRISIKQYNKEIENAEARIAKGKYKTHEQVVKELSKW